MIGFYNYTVILTYLSLASAVISISFSATGHYKLAILCISLSGLFDMFDGAVARRKPNRTEDEKNFGIQIDSLCDAIAFGAAPAVLAYHIGMRGPFSMAILIFYVLAGVIRLAYFNVLESRPQKELTADGRKCYHGLPITSIAVILPISFVVSLLFVPNFLLVIHCTMLLTGILFIVDFKIPKFKPTTMAVIITIVAVCLAKLFRLF